MQKTPDPPPDRRSPIEAALDEALDESFPASDPIAIAPSSTVTLWDAQSPPPVARKE